MGCSHHRPCVGRKAFRDECICSMRAKENPIVAHAPSTCRAARKRLTLITTLGLLGRFASTRLSFDTCTRCKNRAIMVARIAAPCIEVNSDGRQVPVRKRLPRLTRLTTPVHHTCSMLGSPTIFVLLKFSARAPLCIQPDQACAAADAKSVNHGNRWQ